MFTIQCVGEKQVIMETPITQAVFMGRHRVLNTAQLLNYQIWWLNTV